MDFEEKINQINSPEVKKVSPIQKKLKINKFKRNESERIMKTHVKHNWKIICNIVKNAEQLRKQKI